MKPSIITYKIHEVAPYINWIYFFHAWGFQPRFAAIANLTCCDACRSTWVTNFDKQEQSKAKEAVALYKEAEYLLKILDKDFCINTVFKLCKANSDGDNLILDNLPIPLLRQQSRKNENDPFLCLSDFVRPISKKTDHTIGSVDETVGVFASSVEDKMEYLYREDPYKHLLMQTLADRLAEAATEKLHEYVRKEAWGYAKNESLPISDLLIEKFQGIRPAVGYPSLPDQSINFLLDKLLNLKQIGVTLTENGAMNPHATVCGFMFAHPASRYFSIGKIGEDQLADYAKRRNKEINDVRKFLAANLSL